MLKISDILKRLTLISLGTILLSAANAEQDASFSIAEFEALEGFVDLYWDSKAGRVLLKVDELDKPFLYQTSLPRGIGSNDIGLDRGQLGATRVVRFIRSGPKILLLEDNLQYRANSDNEDERRAIAGSFARSVIWGFEDIDPSDDSTVIDATAFFLRDAHGVSQALKAMNEGDYSVDNARSAVYLPRTKAFPDNSEVEAVVTFVGEPTGEYLPTVVPDPRAVTVHMHHSFIRLPDDDYEPLPYDPRSGVIGLRYASGGFSDYAMPVGDKIKVDFGRRHRLEKVTPDAAVSEAIEPIVYYLDRGVPEPVRSALLDGALWWNQAFEAAGYKDAFQVRMLPEGADPMDVRYNVIQWVHRSTRGWSYGSSVLDPRTGEIIKGHVSLGSLRVRQDYLIAEGLLAPYEDETVPPDMLEMSLARIRQLSAHEVGHTLGFAHNFAASTQDRASVMDYPFPLLRVDDQGELDLSDAYGVGIGAWDKRTVLYAYQDFPVAQDSAAERQRLMEETIAAGYKFVADSDSRSVATSHPDGNLWDNGSDAVAELEKLLRARAVAIERFSERTIRIGRPMATIEEALVPIFLLHRYQVEAVGKLIGGQYFDYALRGDRQQTAERVSPEKQLRALTALVATLRPVHLRLPQNLVELIAPRVPNNPKTRETFAGATGINFDPLAPAASSVAITLRVLLDPTRAARMARGREPGFDTVLTELLDASWYQKPLSGAEGAIQRQTNMQVLHGLLGLAFNVEADNEVRALTLDAVQGLDRWLRKRSSRDAAYRAHYGLARFEIERLMEDPVLIETLVPFVVPPGSPIGSLSE